MGIIDPLVMSRLLSGARGAAASSLLLLVGPADAQNQGLPGQGSIPSQCREASNGCEVCRIPKGQAYCSLPGIACQPTVWRCIKPQTGPTDSQPAGRPDPR